MGTNNSGTDSENRRKYRQRFALVLLLVVVLPHVLWMMNEIAKFSQLPVVVSVLEPTIKHTKKLLAPVAMVMWIVFSPRLELAYGPYEVVGITIASGLAISDIAKDLYESCYNLDSGCLANEWTCWTSMGAAVVSGGFALHAGMRWWVGS